MSEIILGLDIGMASCGFALVNPDGQEIIVAGVHCFEKKSRTPKKGASLALRRRDKRGARRRIQRRAQRLRNIKRLLTEAGLTLDTAVALEKNPWELRSEALKRKLAGVEFAKALLHIAKRRGFQSNKKTNSNSEDSSTDDGELLKGTKELKAEFERHGFQTIGEYLNEQPKKRNVSGEYTRTVLRQLLRDEVALLFQTQREFGSPYASEVLCAQFCDIAFKQRPLQSTSDMVGNCTLEPTEKRAPKYAPTSERFLLCQKISNLKAIGSAGDEVVATSEQARSIQEKAFAAAKVTFEQVRKILALPPSYRFNLLRFQGRDEDLRAKEKKTTFFEAKGYHDLRRALEAEFPDSFKQITSNPDLGDQVAWILTVEQDPEKIEAELIVLGIAAEAAGQLAAKVSYAQHVNLSLKAMRNLLPYMEQGDIYSEARRAAGYPDDPYVSSAGLQQLPALTEQTRTRNPVVDRAIAESRKVINAVIRRYGMPHRIHIEVARDLGKSWEEREEIEEGQKKYFSLKEEVTKDFEEVFGRKPRPDELLRFRLAKEQSFRCPYSGKNFAPDAVLDGLLLQVDHIIPYSRSFDDSLMNRVLVYTSENQIKKNRTPFEYFGDDEERWQRFEADVLHLPFPKRRRLLRKSFDEKDSAMWKERHLNDTRYIARFLYNYIRSNLAFPGEANEEGEVKRRRVATRTGQLTSQLRWQWGLHKDREENDLHHAQDAIVVAMATNSMEQLITRAAQNRELFDQKADSDRLPLPWPSFRDDVKRAVDAVFVSRRPERGVRGAAHEETIRSQRVDRSGETVVLQRVALEAVKLKQLELLYQKERNVRLYDAIRERLMAHGDDPKKAFKDPLYMPTKNPGSHGPEVKGITIQTNDKSGVAIGGAGKDRRGLASNGSMIRVDLFKKAGKYYCVPIYASDFAKGQLPNRAVAANKPETEWPVVDSSYEFCFSIYRNDYLKLDKGKELVAGYYREFDRATGAITLLRHGGGEDAKIRGIGARTLKKIEKYSVGYFGELNQVTKEKRLDVAHRLHRKRGKTQKGP